MNVLAKVTQWLGAIELVREELDFSSAEFGDATILALLHVESGGDIWAHRDGSQYWGALQMGRGAGLDVGIDDTRVLHGDIFAALRAFMLFQHRYRERTDSQPSRQAAMWKGGPGCAKTIRNKMREGFGWTEALEHAEQKHQVPNLREYVRRFTAAFQSYAIWLDDLDTPYPRLCPVPDEPAGRNDDD